MKSYPLQTIENLKGEVEFRKKLAKQHVTGEMLLPDYFSKEEHDKILFDRVNTTARKVTELKERGVRISPFLEMGAERSQRALVLTNDFNANGFAVDISYHQLKTADYFAKLFNKPKLPYRVCCDVNNLPFKSNSFPFVFCYEFLHHFPSPKPIMQEAYRVLSDGRFFFDEEPFKNPHVILYRKRHKTCLRVILRRYKVIRFIERFISEGYCDQREHGIIENVNISLQEWIDSLSVFDEKEVYISSLNKRITTVLGDRIMPRNIPNMLLGGSVEGLCRKRLTTTKNEKSNILDLLTCPNCAIELEDKGFDRPSLIREPKAFKCSVCGSSFPLIDNIIFLLPKNLFQELYPDLTIR